MAAPTATTARTRPVDLTRHRPRGPLNRRALRKYAEFWTALQAVADALEQAERLAAKAVDAQPPRASSGAGGRRSWSAASPEEMRAAAKKAHASLRVIATSAKRWEADLVSRDWRA
jgi:hypothetical protein